MGCEHVESGMCQSCTFEWLRAEVERLTIENILLKAKLATRDLAAREVAGEDLGDVLEMVIK